MKELPMFTYNLWMDCLHPDKSSQLFCPVIDIAMSNNLNTLMSILHNFSSNKDRCIHTSTVTILHYCSGKKYVYALMRASCFYIKINILEHFFKIKYTTKVLEFHGVLNFSWEHAPNPVASVQIQYYIIIVIEIRTF